MENKDTPKEDSIINITMSHVTEITEIQVTNCVTADIMLAVISLCHAMAKHEGINYKEIVIKLLEYEEVLNDINPMNTESTLIETDTETKH